MWKKLALLLIIGLAATASAQDAATASPATESIPFLEIPVKIADTRVDLGLFEGDNVNEAVEKFGADNSLDADSLATLKAEVTRRLVSIAEAVTKNIQQSKQTKEPLFEFPVALDDGEVVPLRLFEGDNLQEAVAAFAKRQSIPEDLVPVLFEQVRAKVFPGDAAQDAAQDAGAAPTAASSEDGSAEDPVFSIPITVFGKEEQMKLFKGDVLGERVRAFATMHGLDEETEAKVLEAVAERIRSTQESVAAAEANRAAKDRAGAPTPPTSEPKAPLYEISFKNAEGNVYPLRLYEGDVLEKAVTDFVTEHGFDTTDIPILVEQVSARMRSDAEQKAATSPGEEGNVAAGTDRLVTLAVSMEDPDPSKPPLPPIALHRGETPEQVAN
jgi:predicted transcriptional regulator